MEPNQAPEELIKKYIEGTCTDQEIAIVESWHLHDLSHSYFVPASESIARVNTKMRKKVIAYAMQHNRSYKLWPRIAAAASVLLVFGIGVYYIRDKSPEKKTAKIQVHDIQPGGNKAILTLANGKQISLSGVKTGTLAKEGHAAIHAGADGSVAYQEDGLPVPDRQLTYNSIATPNGGQYQVTLSDGTRAWLNSASSIRYPTVFSVNERKVEITGEVYFEVVHNTARPFRVVAGMQRIEVLGTHFNINAYPNENAVKTTLLQGSIRLSALQMQVVLKPGQQAQLAGNTIAVKNDAYLDEAIAWHNGLFQFHDADIQTVMRQLSRWYDVDISYEGKIPDRRFSGKIFRNSTALKVSDILSYKKIHFRIEGKKIIVTP